MTALGFNRRDVLSAGAGAAGVGVIGLAPFAGSAQAAAGQPQVRVVAEVGAPESRRFASAFARSKIIAVSPGLTELLDPLNVDVVAGALAGTVVGLTSDPAAMIAEQLLVERGGRPLFRWVHRYEGGGWRHDVDAAVGALARSGGAWPVALAGIVADKLALASGNPPQTCFSGPCLLARRSPGLLVSWAYEMVA
ncbi:MAG: hypothetical protein JWN69_402 [Alphaproteobacteria bacterium]|nr:hypothetical protein [Alphaproteobacteria bacterium]